MGKVEGKENWFLVMEELTLTDARSTPLPVNISSSSSTLRFLGLINQPGSASATLTRDDDDDPLELHESDVVWSFALSPDSHSTPKSTSSSPPSHHHQNHHHHHQRFNPARSGLSAALSDEYRNQIRRKSAVNPRVIPQSARQEGNFAAKLNQSAPVNIPMWRKEFRESWKRFEDDDDEGAGEREMVPPHLIVARSHVTFSVFEGAGRTLKGRDLRRVRNAVFQKTGFVD